MTGNQIIADLARSHAFLSASAFAGKYRIACQVKNSPHLATGERPAPLPPETVAAAYEDYCAVVARVHGKRPDVKKR